MSETILWLEKDYGPKLSDVSPTNLKVSTITVSFQTNLSFCNLNDVDSFRKHLPDTMTVNKPRGKNGDMLNCLIFKLVMPLDMPSPDVKKTTCTVSIMLFVNGAMNITGCRNVNDAGQSAHMMCSILDNVHGDLQGSVKLRSFNVQMINTNFQTATGLNLNKLYALLCEKYKATVTFDKELGHPGILWQFATSHAAKKTVTIAIFSSGNVIITGVVAPLQLREAFIGCTQVLNTHFIEVCHLDGWFDDDDVPKVAKRGRKRKSEKEAIEATLKRLAA